jgi:hypothetical protein
MDTTTDIANTPVTQTRQPVIERSGPPNDRSSTVWIVFGLAVLLLVLFGVALAGFFWFFNGPATHQITVLNNCPQAINVLFGVITSGGTPQFFNPQQLSSGQTASYFVTPGVSIVMQAYHLGDTLVTSGVNPFTTVELTLSGRNFTGNPQATNGSSIITNVLTNMIASDQYAVSMQGGFNIPITITSTGFNNRDPQNRFSCVGPAWNRGINSNQCPLELQSPGTGSQYEVCLAPCTAIGGPQFCCSEPGICGAQGGCQSQWPDPSLFTVFKDACPNCLVTNCETLNFSCGNSGGLTQYLITVCP